VLATLIRNQIANGKYSINFALVVTCESSANTYAAPMQLMPSRRPKDDNQNQDSMEKEMLKDGEEVRERRE